MRQLIISHGRRQVRGFLDALPDCHYLWAFGPVSFGSYNRLVVVDSRKYQVCAMRNLPTEGQSNQKSLDEWRQRMLDETSRFIEWGLGVSGRECAAFRRSGSAAAAEGFSDSVKQMFWSMLFRDADGS